MVQGVGHVGYHLCKELHASGARLTVADVDPHKSERAARKACGAEPKIMVNTTRKVL